MNLELVNAWTERSAREAFRHCCGSARWSELMANLRPFDSEAALYAAADRIWWGLERADWLEAFGAHPKIGDLDALRSRFATTAACAAREQAGVIGAADDLLRELAEENRHYEERFGYIFIVCATGKTGDEMLDLLKKRLSNDADDELKLAAAEQAKITRIRLERIAT